MGHPVMGYQEDLQSLFGLDSVDYKVDLTVYPPKEGTRPFRETTRLCFADFFPMFEVPFLYGNGWTREADEARELAAAATPWAAS